MALFTNKADASLPLLTKVQQVRLYGRKGEKIYDEIMRLAVSIAATGEYSGFRHSSTEAGVALLWNACELSQQILEYAIEKINGEYSTTDTMMMRLHDLMQQIKPFPPVVMPRGGSPEDLETRLVQRAQNPNQRIPMSHYTFFYANDYDVPMKAAYDVLLALGRFIDSSNSLHHYPQIYDLLERCPECKNVFLTQWNRKEQLFCSNRCSARAGERRRRAARNLKEEPEFDYRIITDMLIAEDELGLTNPNKIGVDCP